MLSLDTYPLRVRVNLGIDGAYTGDLMYTTLDGWYAVRDKGQTLEWPPHYCEFDDVRCS